MHHALTIIVALGVLALAGCASQRPDVALEATAWSVEDLDGWGVLDRAFPTLTFRGDGQVAGSTGCNQYFGTYRIDGDEIIIGSIGQTKRACEEALMAQETRFLELLEGRHTVGPWDSDQLILTGSRGSLTLSRDDN